MTFQKQFSDRGVEIKKRSEIRLKSENLHPCHNSLLLATFYVCTIFFFFLI